MEYIWKRIERKKGSYRTLEAKVKIEYICIVAIIEEVSVDRADNT
jgi:hypothetical protein